MGKINPEATKELYNGAYRYLGMLFPEDLVDVLEKDLLRRRMKAASGVSWSVLQYIKKNNIDLSNPAHVKQLQEELLDVDNFRLRLNNP
ncbi:hypothetical protein KNT87_gp072 [Erwinia phage Cronus]|uniref:Uncharacterized protein n=1 Tax=Erwinia phage Cronus TaxID=2163633 RepID=A0A2S1GM95_9CAUD|nr:hypothetical protein KNT87_gp072 [Erwinia phage Cronus]AWD90511.1 hypothetical protein [Erwinia phage Cronus]